MKSVLRYIGQKDIDITKYNINESKIYVEPFGGSFNTGFNLIDQGYKGRLIYNDLDNNVYNFWVQVRDSVEQLSKYIETLEYIVNKLKSKIERERAIMDWLNDSDCVKRAAAEYIYRYYLTMNGLSFARVIDSFFKLDLILASELLSKIELYNTDARDIIKEFDSSVTFMLIDPPYKVKGVNSYYRCNSSKFNHQDLYEKIKSLKSKWLLTYNKDECIKELYKLYDIEEVNRIIMGKQYKEYYIKNY